MLSKLHLAYYGTNKNLNELSIYNWDMCLTNNDTGYLCKKYLKISFNSLDGLFTILFNEFIKDIGLGESTLQYYDKLKERHAYQQEYINGNRSKYSFAKMVGVEIETLIRNKVKEDLATSAAYASKHQGYRVDTKKTSVKEFYAIFNTIKNDSKNNK